MIVATNRCSFRSIRLRLSTSHSALAADENYPHHVGTVHRSADRETDSERDSELGLRKALADVDGSRYIVSLSIPKAIQPRKDAAQTVSRLRQPNPLVYLADIPIPKTIFSTSAPVPYHHLLHRQLQQYQHQIDRKPDYDTVLDHAASAAHDGSGLQCW